jgi:hypothetical protein
MPARAGKPVQASQDAPATQARPEPRPESREPGTLPVATAAPQDPAWTKLRIAAGLAAAAGLIAGEILNEWRRERPRARRGWRRS